MSETSSYFNCHIDCFGYLNSIRDVPFGKGKNAGTFVACSISALQGPKEKPDYCNFQAKVSGRDAEHLINRCRDAVKAKRKVLVGVRLGDPWIDQFTYPPGHEKAGQPGASIKTRLLLIKWIKVDGVKVYSRPKDDPSTQNRDASTPNDSDVANLPTGEPSNSQAAEVPAEAEELADKAA